MRKTQEKWMFFLLLAILAGIGIYCVGTNQTQENPYSQEKYVGSCQQIDTETNSFTISSVKLVREGDIEKIHIEYPCFNDASDEVSSRINKQIYDKLMYHEATGGSLLENNGLRTEVDITYDITYVGDNIISILFHGDIVGGWHSTDFNKGLNFNLLNGELLSIGYFYELEQIRDLLEEAMSKECLTGVNLPSLNREQEEEYFGAFLKKFDTDDYIKRTDNFFIQEDSICFIADPLPSFREYIYIEWKLEEIPAIQSLEMAIDAPEDVERICEMVRAMDFTVEQPHMELTEEEDRAYKEAFLRILKNELPIEGYAGGDHYENLWKSIPYDELLEWRDSERPAYYYDDIDGDGKPEFGVKSGCVYFFDYELGEDACSISYDEQSEYFGSVLGVGKIWYRDYLHAWLARDRYIVLNSDGEWEIVLDLEYGAAEPHFYDINGVNVGKKNWEELTASFFEATEHEVPKKTMTEVFGELLD